VVENNLPVIANCKTEFSNCIHLSASLYKDVSELIRGYCDINVADIYFILVVNQCAANWKMMATDKVYNIGRHLYVRPVVEFHQ